MCDNKGPTLSIIQSDTGYLFGGYTPTSWGPIGTITTTRDTIHPEHFLFTLSNPHNIPPTQYKLKNPKDPNAICNDRSLIVAFGSGIDLCVYGISQSYSCFGDKDCSYCDTTGKENETFTGTTFFKPKEVDVYLVI